MLAWSMNLGFAASPAGQQALASCGGAPFTMGMGDELWLSIAFLALTALWRIA